jgi:hypothetical protein
MPPESSPVPTPRSKPLILVGVLILLTVGVGLIPAQWFGITPKRYEPVHLDLAALNSINDVAQDSNGDGIVSWGELTNELFTDDETTLGALKNGQVDEKIIAELNDPNNLTASFSKNFYILSSYLKQTGATDDASQTTAINQLIADEAKKIIPTEYQYKDINVAQTESKATIKAYGNIIAPLLRGVVTEKMMTSDLTAINSFAETEDVADLLSLSENRNIVDTVLKKFLAVSVPPSAVPYHILGLNRIALYRDTLDNISKAKTDPLRANVAMQKYLENAILLIRLESKFAEYFAIQNVAFSSKEAGYTFTSGYTVQNN